jgi:hypothetical protein
VQRVLSPDLWKATRLQARKAQRRKAAIAYVTRDLIGFRKGDVLVMDASRHAIASGETDARLLRTLCHKGVRLFHCQYLHAKVLLLDDTAVISSGNMSSSSANGLIEAAVLTDHASTVSAVASLIEQLVEGSSKLGLKQIDRLCRIKVIRRGGRGTSRGRKRRKPMVTRLGDSTWLVGACELVRDPPPDEQKMISKAKKALRRRLGDPDEEPDWIRWTGRNRFVRECREGDSLIQIWRPRGAKQPTVVYRHAPVLLKQRTKRWTRFYLPQPSGRHAEMPWNTFQRFLKELGYARRLGPRIEHLLETDIADTIDRRWEAAAKS